MRVSLITLGAFALVYCFFFTRMYVVTFLTGLGMIAMIAELIRYIDKTNRDIASFLLSIRHDDYSTSFSGKKLGSSFMELYESLNLITDQFQRIRAEKETNFQYMQTVVKHVNVGLICFDEEGEVQLMNKAIRQLLHKPYLKNIDSLARIDGKLFESLQHLAPGERELLKVQLGNEMKQLAVQAVEFKLQDKPYRLISMQDIKGELEANEVEAWQKLIRILTHEIMNSVSPIASLSGTIQDILKDDDSLAKSEAAEDLNDAIEAIQKRSQGLMHFTEAYRDLTRLPVPQFQAVRVIELLERIGVLFKAELEEKRIDLNIHVPDANHVFQADPELLEQVLINLLQNSMDVLGPEDGGKIWLSAQRNEDDKTIVRITDNGPGIPEELIEQIFIPFYTTKKTGSGIGLSLSRQIMRLHKGTLSVQSEPGTGASFTLLI